LGYVGRREKREVDGQRGRGRGETGAKEGRKRDNRDMRKARFVITCFLRLLLGPTSSLSYTRTDTRALSHTLSLLKVYDPMVVATGSKGSKGDRDAPMEVEDLGAGETPRDGEHHIDLLLHALNIIATGGAGAEGGGGRGGGRWGG
jgi:hypothetical protein